MPGLSRADFGTSPPRIDIPRDYNAAHDLIERNLAAGRAGKVAYIDDRGRTTFGELAARVNRFANALVELGMRPEERVLVCLLDSVDFPTAFLGCIKAGIVPIAANTLLTPTDYAYMLNDSRARTLVVSGALLPSFLPILAGMKHLKHVIVSGDAQAARPAHALDFDALLKNADDAFDAAPTTRDDVCFWLYSSGSTGAPKGTVHVHSSLIQTAGRAARHVSGRVIFYADEITDSLTYSHAIVDAVFGTGLRGEVAGLPADVIRAINAAGKPLVAVDIPSGMDADTGENLGVCVNADCTVTFALPKIGLLTYPGVACVGKLIVADIGIPKCLFEEITVELVDDAMVAIERDNPQLKSVLPIG